MKKIILIGFLCGLTFSVFSQSRDGSNERIETMKISFITQRLDLNPEQAQKFWPVYNQMNNDMKAVRQANRNGKQKPFDELSDADVEQNIESELNKEQQILNLKRKYITDLKEVLSIKQVAKLLMAEEHFKRRLIQHMSDRKNQQNKGN